MTTWMALSPRGLERLDLLRGPVAIELSDLGVFAVVCRDEGPGTGAMERRGFAALGVTAIRVDADRITAWSSAEARCCTLHGIHLAVLGGLDLGDAPADRALDELAALGLVGPSSPDPRLEKPPSGPREVGSAIGPPLGPVDSNRRGAIQVHGCHEGEQGVPLAIGMIIAHARRVDDGRLSAACDFRPLGRPAADLIREAGEDQRPVVAFFSNYLWSVDLNLIEVRRLKDRRPDAVTVFGGPSVPKYDAETESFLRENPAVDVLVLGEGEQTAVELLAAVVASDGRLPDAATLRTIPGLAFLDGGQVVRTADRARIADLGNLPSPYLDGLFTDHDGGRFDQWVLETNRGCPYGCSFCDWGSATNSRVRMFPIDRVLAEITHGAERGWNSLFVADANFGMFPRDLEIARWITAEAARCGTPRHVDATFAKKASDRVLEVVRLFCDAGLMREGVLALQSVDPGTLVAISRDNIRTDQYARLASAFEGQGVPLTSDIMVGLPGSTVESFKRDLEHCMKLGVKARVLATQLLPNSPMNDPSYRARHELVVNGRGEVVATSSYSTRDRLRMARLADLYWMAVHLHLFDDLLAFVDREHDLSPMEVLDRIDQVVQGQPDRFPALAFVVRWFHHLQAPPCGWSAFGEDLTSLATTVLGIPAGSSLEAVVAHQCAMLPLPGRRYPEQVVLAHDVRRYHADHAAGIGRPLIEYPAVSLSVDDPTDLGTTAFGVSGTPDLDDHGLPRWHDLDDLFKGGPEWRLQVRSLGGTPSSELEPPTALR